MPPAPFSMCGSLKEPAAVGACLEERAHVGDGHVLDRYGAAGPGENGVSIRVQPNVEQVVELPERQPVQPVECQRVASVPLQDDVGPVVALDRQVAANSEAVVVFPKRIRPSS